MFVLRLIGRRCVGSIPVKCCCSRPGRRKKANETIIILYSERIQGTQTFLGQCITAVHFEARFGHMMSTMRTNLGTHAFMQCGPLSASQRLPCTDRRLLPGNHHDWPLLRTPFSPRGLAMQGLVF